MRKEEIEHPIHSWSEKEIILSLMTLLKIPQMDNIGAQLEEPLDYIHREISEYTAWRGKPPEALFISIPDVTTIFSIPLKISEEVNWMKVKS